MKLIAAAFAGTAVIAVLPFIPADDCTLVAFNDRVTVRMVDVPVPTGSAVTMCVGNRCFDATADAVTTVPATIDRLEVVNGGATVRFQGGSLPGYKLIVSIDVVRPDGTRVSSDIAARPVSGKPNGKHCPTSTDHTLVLEYRADGTWTQVLR